MPLGQDGRMELNFPPLLRSGLVQRFSTFLKMMFIGVLILLLHIPLLMTDGVLKERQGFRVQAAEEIAGSWGRRQTVTGPVLAVPYVYRANVVRTKVVDNRAVQVEETADETATAYFFPETLVVAGNVEPEMRHRGIYDSVVYSSRLTFSGDFQPDFAAAGIENARILWDRAQVLFGVTDLRGIRNVGPVTLNGGTPFPFEAAGGAGLEGMWLGAKITGAAAGTRLSYAFEAALQGSERVDLVPAGKSTKVELRSAWDSPSFGGAYLPVTRRVGPEGFTAAWEISPFSRGFQESWSNRTTEAGALAKKLAAASFGVAFAQPVDGYRLAERAQKYGALFFVIVFAVCFVFELTAGLRIHPLQYTLVGAALCLFFLAFLALSEFMAAGLAYAAAAAACTALVSLYAWSFLRTGRRTLVLGGGLAATYGCLYFVLKSQDYALIAGTAALFAALALVMFATRRINAAEPDLPATAVEAKS
jgi:inner membrane protein